MDGWIDGWMDGTMGGWMAGCMHACMDGWMDGWMHACTHDRLQPFGGEHAACSFAWHGASMTMCWRLHVGRSGTWASGNGNKRDPVGSILVLFKLLPCHLRYGAKSSYKA